MNLKKLNVILVYNKSEDKILMCKRAKEPYKGKYNLVGGKVEPNEFWVQNVWYWIRGIQWKIK